MNEILKIVLILVPVVLGVNIALYYFMNYCEKSAR